MKAKMQQLKVRSAEKNKKYEEIKKGIKKSENATQQKKSAVR